MLHPLFVQHDTELALVVGELAERMRPLGFAAPAPVRPATRLPRTCR